MAKKGGEQNPMELSLSDPGQVGGGRPTFLSPATGCGPTLSMRDFHCLMPTLWGPPRQVLCAPLYGTGMICLAWVGLGSVGHHSKP